MFKIIVFVIITLFPRIYVRVGILLTCGKHLPDHIGSLRVEVWAHIISLTPPRYLSVCTRPGKLAGMYLFVWGIDFVSFYDFSIEFYNCSDRLWIFFISILFLVYLSKSHLKNTLNIKVFVCNKYYFFILLQCSVTCSARTMENKK